VDISPVGPKTGWGESVTWDDRRQRLYFVDCAAQTLHWDSETWKLPSMPTGVVLTEDARLIVVLDDGLHVLDVDERSTTKIADNPPGVDRCNDACADLDGNVVTGKLNMGPDAGSAWRWSPTDGTWSVLDDDIANTNGPNAAAGLLVIGDTSAQYWAYDYDGTRATNRRLAGDVEGTGGRPDGATLDADGRLWAALVGGGIVVRFGADGTVAERIEVGYELPTDVAFGGPALDRLYVTVIDGPLLAIDGVGARGRPEPRARL
jgi:L-arabinonolactonase